MAFNNIGHIYFTMKKYDLAINYYTEAIKIFPKYINAYKNRADAKNALKDFDGACEDLRIAGSLGDLNANKFLRENCK